MHGSFAFCNDCQPSLGEIVFWYLLLLFFSFSKVAILLKDTHMCKQTRDIRQSNWKVTHHFPASWYLNLSWSKIITYYIIYIV